MNPEPPLPPEMERLARAIRFALVSVVAALSYFTIRAASAVPQFDQVFRDLFNGKPLPAITTFVLQVRYALLAFAWLIPVAAVGTLLSRRFVASFYLLGGLCFLVVVLFIFMYQALSAPLFMLLRQMQGG